MKIKSVLIIAIIIICLGGFLLSSHAKQNDIKISHNLQEVPNKILKGSGNITYAKEIKPLNTAQEQLLLDYMTTYYQSLADLEINDPSQFFVSNSRDQALARQNAWRLIIDVRKAQAVDLSLLSFSYNLEVNDLKTDDNGDILITVKEKTKQEFAAFPGITSEVYDVRHRFTLTQENNQWKLSLHVQMDSANMMALGSSARRPRNSDDGYVDLAQLTKQREEILNTHLKNIENRKQQLATYSQSSQSAITWENSYDREKAISYAAEWVGKRNEESWFTYDRSGGNCANFVSQSLLAGGIPMDYSGTNQWKWYSDTPNSYQMARGRSGAWTGVDEFYEYVDANTGYGLVAEADANYWSGEIGDVIQMGYDDDWKHSVIIAQVIKDKNGKTIDYLIHSNTADQKNYPVSAYLYPEQRLIKIYGWNT